VQDLLSQEIPGSALPALKRQAYWLAPSPQANIKSCVRLETLERLKTALPSALVQDGPYTPTQTTLLKSAPGDSDEVDEENRAGSLLSEVGVFRIEAESEYDEVTAKTLARKEAENDGCVRGERERRFIPAWRPRD
jgi:hypothetical protein